MRVKRNLKVGDSSGPFASATKLMKAGKWLGDLDVRRHLFAENPLLKRWAVEVNKIRLCGSSKAWKESREMMWSI